MANAKMLSEFGGIPNDSSVASSLANRDVFVSALLAANASATDKVITVEPDHEYFILGSVSASHLVGVTIQLEGTLTALDNIDQWPFVGNSYVDFMVFTDCTDLKVYSSTGKGLIDGRGYVWWEASLARVFGNHKLKSDRRPKLMLYERCTNLVFSNFKMINSPMWHLNLQDVMDVVISDLTVDVDVTKQRSLHESFGGFLKNSIPLFPLNTDGIDVAGINVLITNFTCTNYDDVVVVKPMDNRGIYSQCSDNIVVDGAKVKWGVGMAIGTVPPRTFHTCIKNVIFRNVYFKDPFKAIYIKTNPGTGSGEIRNITYENIIADRPIWFPIYIGPQQQKQPDGGGPGCMLYPIEKKCDTQPLVTISDITLRNVYMSKALTYAGVIRCDEKNPCSNFVWENVHVSGGLSHLLKYKCEHINGKISNSVPSTCFNSAPSSI
eukprot:GILK01005312.1.p1 GENE.GILK01005312.1~~GILK01005312.1.p1  ORF type:complete len:471 (-),score=64.30 GILK01005312.1:166-1473(-)